MANRGGREMKICLMILIAVYGLATAGFAYANTDYQCLNDCTSKGHAYAYCKSQCTYGGDNQQPQPRTLKPWEEPKYPSSRPDPNTPGQPAYNACIKNCERMGHLYDYCNQQCSH